MYGIDPEKVRESPAWVIDLEALESNLRLLKQVEDESGAKVLLALKAFATWSTFPLVAKYLSGATASSPHEAQLASLYLKKEVHAYAPAYSERDIKQLLPLCDHLVFNSLNQWERFRAEIKNAKQPISCGLRINPEHSEVKVELYDPCARGSRLGVRLADFDIKRAQGLEGLHIHTLCQLGSDALERTVRVLEEKFGGYFSQFKWLNLGGGHHITRSNYDRAALIRLIKRLRRDYGLEIYLEPGEAVAIGTGVLVATVLDIVENDGPIAILDTSATAHMPDILEMPYRPDILHADHAGVRPFSYKLGGLTCLAGDTIGSYSFSEPLRVGSKICFMDMSHYTMVKTSNFNGVRLPSIVLKHVNGTYECVKSFGFESYAGRLG